MPGEVFSVKSDQIEAGQGGQTQGMIRKAAIVGRCEGICASALAAMPGHPTNDKTWEVMIARPHSESAIHHHGEQDTIVYARRGHGIVVTKPKGELTVSSLANTSALLRGPQDKWVTDISQKTRLAPGDFAVIPAFCEHQEVNEGDEEVEWIIHRSGKEPVVVNLNGWNGREVQK